VSDSVVGRIGVGQDCVEMKQMYLFPDGGWCQCIFNKPINLLFAD
jgi:hypothetical protein